MLRPLHVLLTLLILLTPSLAVPARAQIYVDADVTGGANDGTSWADAYTDLQDALATATGSDEIWVAEGTYLPGPNTGDSFTVTGAQDGLEIYGGFNGTETNRSERDVTAHPVVLDGDIDGDGGIGGNSENVLYFDGTTGGPLTTATVLDGVTVTNGINPQVGGGLFCDGSGTGSECSPTIRNAVFSNNAGFSGGGAIFNDARDGGTSSPRIVDVVVVSTGIDAGAVLSLATSGGTSSPTFVNSVFYDTDGEAISSSAQSGGTVTPQIVNSTFFDNTGTDGAIECFDDDNSSTMTITNSIVYGNTDSASNPLQISVDGATLTIGHSLVEGGLSDIALSNGATINNGGGNVSFAPNFYGPSDPDGPDDVWATDDDGLRLIFGAAVDAGDNGAISLTEDLAGAPRVENGTVDMGAYEGRFPRPIYVDDDATGSNDGSSWSDAYTDPQDAFNDAITTSVIVIAGGTYVPGSTQGESFTVTGERDGVHIYGGWAGTEVFTEVADVEDQLDSRDFSVHPTVLSGDVDANDAVTASGVTESTADINGGNSYHVLLFDGSTLGSGITPATVLDGVIVTGGQANDPGSSVNREGGGLRCDGGGSGVNACSPTIRNVFFAGNRAQNGGALYNEGASESSPVITNAVFTGNAASSHGGAIYNDGLNGVSSPTITNATFSGNTAGGDGGAIYNDGSTTASEPTVGNSILHGNSAGGSGGAIHNAGASRTRLLTTLLAGGTGGNPNIDNGSNFSGDPLFAAADAPTGDDGIFATDDDGLYVLPGSPALDAGSNGLIGLAEDIAGADRTQDADGDGTPAVDLGAYEGAFPLPAPQVTNVAPQTTYVGRVVTITGNQFSNITDVSFGGESASVFTVQSSTQLIARVPDGASSGVVAVTNPAGTGSTPFTLRPRNGAEQALSFDGNDDVVAIPDASDLNLSEQTTYTIEAWFNPTVTSTIGKLVLYEQGGTNNGFNLYLYNGTLYAGAWSASNGWNGTWLSTDVSRGEWHHVALVFDQPGGEMIGYLDGVPFGNQGPGSAVAAHANNIGVGGLADKTKFHDDFLGDDEHVLFGTIDELRIWNTARTQGQIQQAMSQTLAGNESGLVAYWRFDAGTGDTLYDTANAHDGTLTNGPQWVDSTAPLLGLQVYVDADATGANNGTSWSDAFTDPQDALGVATSSNEIWIADGTYRPTDGSDRSVSFRLTGAKDGLELYGGFDGTETSRSERDVQGNAPVVLSGDVGAAGDHSDNSYNVLFFDGTTGGSITPATMLDGVTVTRGRATGGLSPPSDQFGAGLYCNGSGSGNECSPTLSHVVFTKNRTSSTGLGGAIFNDASDGGVANPVITHAVFANNRASKGGAIYNSASEGTSSPQITNALFTGNTASDDGGAIYNSVGSSGGTGSPTITNATFTRNSAVFFGGAMASNENGGTSEPVITNSIFFGNSDSQTSEEQIFNFSGATPTIRHTLIEDGCPTGSDCGDGSTIIDADPLFLTGADPDGPDDVFATGDDGLRLIDGSPALDAGDNTAVPSGLTTDLVETNRIQDGTVDLGAYEGAVPATLTIEGTAGADGTDAGWRFIGVPASIPVQAGDLRLGGTAPDFTLPSGHMLQTWDDDTGAYEPLGPTDNLQPGRGYAVYLFDQNPFALDPSMTIDVAGDPALRGDQGVTVSGLATSAQWHLLANPYPSGYALSSFTDLPGNGFQAQIQRFDATAGSWVVKDQSQAEVSAWQGFFIERTDPGGSSPGATSVTFDPAGRIAGAPFVGSKDEEKTPPVQHARLALGLVVSSAEGDTLSRDHAAQVVFDERADSGWDAWDGSKLVPLAAEHVLLAPEGLGRDGTPVQKAVESRPWPSERQEIPLRLIAEGLDGRQEATLAVRRWDLPEGWQARIVDTETGEPQQLAAGGTATVALPTNPTDTTSRYELQVAPDGAPLPVELTAFEATETGEGTVRLTWQTASETNNAGFRVQRRVSQASDGRPTLSWKTIGTLEGNGTTQTPQTYRFADADPPFAADTLSYRLQQIDTDGTARLSDVITVARRKVTEVQLRGSFPNPTRTQATIRYALPKPTEVRLAVYDVLGRRVMTLVDRRQEAGRKQIRLDSRQLSGLASGTYFYRLTAGGTTKTRKLTIVR